MLDGLGAWPGADLSGIDAGIVRPTSIGKHRQGLSQDEIDAVERNAGTVMSKLGYQV